MHGILQMSFFFGYNALACFAFFLMLGSIGWRASLLFVRSIYKVSTRTHATRACIVVCALCLAACAGAC